MDYKKTCLAMLAVAALSNLYCYSQGAKVYVAKYKSNKACAVSLSVEEGKNRLTVSPSISLDRELFTEPLSLVVETEGV